MAWDHESNSKIKPRAVFADYPRLISLASDYYKKILPPPFNSKTIKAVQKKMMGKTRFWQGHFVTADLN